MSDNGTSGRSSQEICEIPSDADLSAGMQGLAKSLASEERNVRTVAVLRLKSFISSRVSNQNFFTNLELKKLWKCLYYCMWMCDNMVRQEKLSIALSKLTSSFLKTRQKMKFISAFFVIMKREWVGVDKHRQDKFLFLIRRMVRAAVLAVNEDNLSLTSMKLLSNVLTNDVFNTGSLFTASTVEYHVCDVFFDEVAGVIGDKVNHAMFMRLVYPFLNYLQYGKDCDLCYHMTVNMFLELIGLQSYSTRKTLNAKAGDIAFDRILFANHLKSLSLIEGMTDTNRSSILFLRKRWKRQTAEMTQLEESAKEEKRLRELSRQKKKKREEREICAEFKKRGVDKIGKSQDVKTNNKKSETTNAVDGVTEDTVHNFHISPNPAEDSANDSVNDTSEMPESKSDAVNNVVDGDLNDRLRKKATEKKQNRANKKKNSNSTEGNIACGDSALSTDDKSEEHTKNEETGSKEGTKGKISPKKEIKNDSKVEESEQCESEESVKMKQQILTGEVDVNTLSAFQIKELFNEQPIDPKLSRYQKRNARKRAMSNTQKAKLRKLNIEEGAKREETSEVISEKCNGKEQQIKEKEMKDATPLDTFSIEASDFVSASVSENLVDALTGRPKRPPAAKLKGGDFVRIEEPVAKRNKQKDDSLNDDDIIEKLPSFTKRIVTQKKITTRSRAKSAQKVESQESSEVTPEVNREPIKTRSQSRVSFAVNNTEEENPSNTSIKMTSNIPKK